MDFHQKFIIILLVMMGALLFTSPEQGSLSGYLTARPDILQSNLEKANLKSTAGTSLHISSDTPFTTPRRESIPSARGQVQAYTVMPPASPTRLKDRSDEDALKSRQQPQPRYTRPRYTRKPTPPQPTTVTKTSRWIPNLVESENRNNPKNPQYNREIVQRFFAGKPVRITVPSSTS